MDQIMSNIGLLIDYPIANIKILLDGAMIGALFALAAYGLALVWGVMNVKNLAQGDFVIGGGYVSWWLNHETRFGELFGALGPSIGPLLGIPIAFMMMALLGGALHGTRVQKWAGSCSIWMVAVSIIAVFALISDVPLTYHLYVGEWYHSLIIPLLAGVIFGLFEFNTSQNSNKAIAYGLAMFGVVFIASIFYGRPYVQVTSGILLTIIIIINGGIYNLIISRVIERDLFTSLLATFGLAIMGAQIMNLLFGSDTQSLVLDVTPLGLQNTYYLDSNNLIDLPAAKVIGVILAIALAVSVIMFMKRSRMGQAIRATAQDARAARVMGIDTEKVYAFTFSLNSAICGAAGAIIVMVWVIQPFYGITYSIRSFVIVTAAGLGNLPGVFAAGLGIGAAEQYASHIFGIGYQQAIAVLLLLLVLVFRLWQQKRNRQVLQ